MNRRSRFCDQCGARLPFGSEWPKQCQCGPVYANPTPIAVTLISVYHPSDPNRVGILVGRRNHEPAMGRLGLPGGFQDDSADGETLRQAAVREVREEMGLHLSEHLLDYHYEFSNPAQSQTLVFFRYRSAFRLTTDVRVGKCEVSPECDFIDVAWEPEDLAFISHTRALAHWFALRESRNDLFTRPVN